MTQSGALPANRPGAVRVRVPAKINLRLSVGAPRPDGFHPLDTVYQAISLYDEISIEHADRLRLTLDGIGANTLPTDGTNLAVRAAALLADRLGVAPNVAVHLDKHIPLAGGLAGGSADAAAVLVGCDALWRGGHSRADLAALAADLGSDVPFLVIGGTAHGTGRGELVEPVPAVGPWHWVVAAADGGLSTPRVYGQLDALRATGAAPPPTLPALPDDDAAGPARDLAMPSLVPDRLLAALRSDDPAELAATLANDLQPASIALRPALRRTLDAGLAAGALAALVSGSGPSCLCLAADAADAARIAAELTERGVCSAAHVAVGPVAGATVLT
ncbi:4-(cytidine 5'-diphospho)-2-C-methyl-D-erythritol kinase [Actinocatenispora sera]|uniref:4-diphosphocytidyl-2-C-methyl-D-erythritol kinase n=1 Tax=Actinocatenispora sera TaxID=390989 RepID=A0A810KV17_9ACTN|nr:4-(cytidine 5'-diphospho)-2-C-methyl-D-erythritol kinase [Actinocatenispora sera]BCJ26151.1 4-diphosphocytidyl-2-C-methyl-D-erythritol kinase [Actinocatenispora sera]